MIVDRLQREKHPLADEKVEQSVDERRVVGCRKADLLAQEPAERAPIAEPISSTARFD